MPLITVAIPLYNKEKHIQRALDSVLSQSFEDFEIVVVDDASKDNGGNLVRAYTDPRIRLFKRSEPGPGGYAARNLAIDSANGQWIAFLDADDEWEPDHLARFITALAQYPSMRLYASAYRKHYGNNRYEIFGAADSCTDDRYKTLDYADFLESIVAGKAAMWTSATIVHRSLFAEAGQFPAGLTRSGGDTDTWLRLNHCAGSMIWSARPTVTYHLDAENRVMKSFDSYEKDHLVTATCDRLIAQATQIRHVKLLRQVQARKFYERAMALKRYHPNWWYALPSFRAYYLYIYPKSLLAIVPNFVFRAFKSMVEK